MRGRVKGMRVQQKESAGREGEGGEGGRGE